MASCAVLDLLRQLLVGRLVREGEAPARVVTSFLATESSGLSER